MKNLKWKKWRKLLCWNKNWNIMKIKILINFSKISVLINFQLIPFIITVEEKNKLFKKNFYH